MNTQPLILDIGHIQRRIHAVQLDIARYGVTLRLADFATLLMLFVFLVGFYVADPFHIASFIAQRFGANGTVELAVYALLLVMAGLMAVTIARLKRAHYEHKAKYRFSGSVWKVGCFCPKARIGLFQFPDLRVGCRSEVAVHAGL